MSKTYYNQTIAITARPRSKRLREAGGYYTAITAGKNAGSNAGQTVADGGVSGLFEEILDSNSTIVGIKALHDLFIIQEAADEEEGTQEVKKNISDILRHLTLATDNGITYLVADIPLGTESNLFSGGYAREGGGGSGSIATLVDVTLTDLADKQILLYNSQTNHWENKTLTLTLEALTDVALSNPTNGQALVYNSSLQKWVAATIDTSVIVDNKAADIGTGLTTIATINGTNITAKITHQSLSGYATQRWVENRGYITSSALIGYATEAWVTGTALSGYATQTWVGNQGYLTSSSLSGYATQSWVNSQNFLTSSDLSGYATQSWVTGRGYTTLTEVAAWATDEGLATQTWVENRGYITSSALIGYATEVWVIGTALSGYATQTWVGNNFLNLSGGTITGNLRLGSVSGSKLNFGDSEYVYLYEDVDDHLSIYAKKGVDLNTSSTSYGLTVGSSSNAAPTILKGTLAVSGNTTLSGTLVVGATSATKTVTIYGSTTAALTIYGTSGNNNYSTKLYRDASWLQISSGVYVTGNFAVTGNCSMGTVSDRRLKDDVKDIDLNDAAEVLSALRPVTFNWNQDAERLSEGQLHGTARGFIADEYLKQLPNAGKRIWGEYNSLYYEQTIPYLVAGWKQEDMRIRTLKDEISSLKEEIHGLRRRLREHGIQ